MQIKTQCPNEACGRTLVIEDFEPGMNVACPFCSESFVPPTPEGLAPRPAAKVDDELALAALLGDGRGRSCPPPQQTMAPSAARPKAPSAMLARLPAPRPSVSSASVPAPNARAKKPGALSAPRQEAPRLPSSVPTKPDIADFEVIEEDETPLMAIPIEDETPALATPLKPPLANVQAARPAAKTPPGKPAVLKAVLIEEGEEPVLDAILIRPPKPPQRGA